MIRFILQRPLQTAAWRDHSGWEKYRMQGRMLGAQVEMRGMEKRGEIKT